MSKRKRSKPSYLKDFCSQETYEEDFHVEPEKLQKMSQETTARIEEHKSSNLIQTQTVFEVKSEIDKCCICEEKMSSKIDIVNSTGSSELSYAEVLNDLFSSKAMEMIPKLSFTTGNICVFCKVPIQDLDLLQHKVKGLIKVILTRLSAKLKRLESCMEEPKAEAKKAQAHNKVPLKRRKVEDDSENDSSLKEEDMVMSKRKKEDASKASAFKIKPLKRRKFEDDSENDSSLEDEEEDMVRPKREKTQNTMSEIERAKIKNLPTDLKFQVKKRSKADPYIIEYLSEKKGSMYLVKWENRHEKESTWENRSKIPASVLKYYEEDLRRLGTQVPIQIPQKEDTEKPQNNNSKSKISRKISEKEENVNCFQELDSLFEGEYIEPPCEELNSPIKRNNVVPINKSNAADESQKEIEVSIEIRKSKREPKPNKFDDEMVEYVNNVKTSTEKQQKKVLMTIPETYNIEALMQKKGDKYLVKWENYPPSQNTWEPKSSIPKFIVKFYEQDLSRLGMPAPDVT